MKSRNLKLMLLVAGMIQWSSCVVYGPRTYYRGHFHRPHCENHHGSWGHPYGTHYNQNKNFVR